MIIVVSKCLNGEEGRFKFKGYLRGKKVDEVKVKIDGGRFKAGDDYMIAVDVERIEEGVIFGKVLKYKRI